MQVTKKAGTDFYLKIGSTSNMYNIPVDQFKGLIINEIDGSSSMITNSFSEILKTVDGNTSTVSGTVPEKSKLIPVDDGTQFQDGDVITIGTNYYYIESISGNVLTIKEESAGHLESDVVTQVGNTGIYKVLMNLPVGLYTVMIENRAINMQNTPIALEIVESNLQDVIAKSKQKSFI
jgi:hypothetical protein